MYALKEFECKNFYGIYNGLSKTKLTLNFSEYLDKKIFIIIGGNAHGKSTLLSILHPFSGTTDKRNKFVRENKEGYKKLTYVNVDNPNIEIKIQHNYTPNKADSHSVKSYIFKYVDGEEIDLNPNGNVGSFAMAVKQEFGIDEDFLKVSSQNEQMMGIIEMTDTSRKDYVYNFIPQADDNTVYQRIVGTKLRDVKSYLSSLIDKIGKMPDEVSLYEKLKDTETEINELVEKRDRTLGKINGYKAQISALDPDDKLIESYKEIKKALREFNDKSDKAHDIYIRFISVNDELSDITLSSIDKEIDDILSKLVELNTAIVNTTATISSKKTVKANLYDSLTDKENMINQFSGTQSIEDIDELLASYRYDLSAFDTRLKSMNTSLTAEDLIHGIDVLSDMRQYLYDIYNSADTNDLMQEAISSKNIEDKYNATKSKLDSLRSEMDRLSSSISTMNSYNDTKNDINKRPKECTIDDCAFLTGYNKWKELDAKVSKFKDDLDIIIKDYDTTEKRLEHLTELHITKIKVDNLLMFHKSNSQLLSKLPFNDKYATSNNLLSWVIKRDMLVGAEDSFYDIIEILQDKEKYDNIRNIKIPRLLDERKQLSDNKNFIDNLKKDIDKLTDNYNKELQEIDTATDELDILEEKVSDANARYNSLLKLKELLINSDEIKKEILIFSDKFDKIQDTSERIAYFNSEIEERKDKLKSIDEKLKPLSSLRDTLKYNEIKLQEYKKEKELLEENYKILELIHRALSTSKGIGTYIIKMYIDTIRRSANMLLSECYDGTLYLETFEIDDKKFKMPFIHGGDIVDDVSTGSTSERAFIANALSMAIIEQIIMNYGILLLDESDAGMSKTNKNIYANIIMKQMKRIGITQTFIVTHGSEFYEKYNNDVCFILFPEHNLKSYENYSHIKVY